MIGLTFTIEQGGASDALRASVMVRKAGPPTSSLAFGCAFRANQESGDTKVMVKLSATREREIAETPLRFEPANGYRAVNHNQI